MEMIPPVYDPLIRSSISPAQPVNTDLCMPTVTYSLSRTKALLRCTYVSCLQHNQLNNAAALSFFFLLSLSPLLIFLVSLIALLPLSNSDRHILEVLSQIMPADAMEIMGRLLTAIFQRKSNLLSLGFLGAIWAGSTGFNAMILALNSAYLARRRGAHGGRDSWCR